MDSDSLIKRVSLAKKDSKEADRLIQDYMPFIKAETSKFIGRSAGDSDDELSIAMFAFYEAIKKYSILKGSFLKFASLHIRHRLIDYNRREKRSQGLVSLDTPISEENDGLSLADTVQDGSDPYEENELREATKQEIEHLSEQLQDFGLSFADISDNAPKQQRTLEACRKAVVYAKTHPELLEELLRTKKIPLGKLSEGAGVERKTLERHRKYMVSILLIYTNGYEILRGHIMKILKGGGNT